MADENPALEVKSSGDDAWFEARVEIDPADPSRLLAKVPGLEEDSEVFVSKEEVRSRIRFPSAQVTDSKCSEVKEGDDLLVLNNTPTSSRYFEASVAKVERHEHTKKLGHEVCTCEFLVRWLSGPDKGETSVVGCECLCHASKTPLDTHPVVSKYLSA